MHTGQKKKLEKAHNLVRTQLDENSCLFKLSLAQARFI